MDAAITGPARRAFLLCAILILSAASACTPVRETGDGPDTQATDNASATSGTNVPASKPDATAAAESGNPLARFLDDPTNPESWRWLCQAAAGGNTAAQYTVAIRYRDGLPPVSRDVERAYRWLTAATRNGLSAAALARDDLARSIPETKLADLRKEKRTASETDCRIDKK